MNSSITPKSNDDLIESSQRLPTGTVPDTGASRRLRRMDNRGLKAVVTHP